MAKPDPCGMRYGLWRARALALAANEDVYGGALQRALDDAGIHVVVGTLHPALAQMVAEGLLERVAGKHGHGLPRMLRITPRGREVLDDLRRHVASLLNLIDGRSGHRPMTVEERNATARGAGGDAVERLVAIAQEIQRTTARLRRALDQAKALVDGALSQAAGARRARDA